MKSYDLWLLEGSEQGHDGPYQCEQCYEGNHENCWKGPNYSKCAPPAVDCECDCDRPEPTEEEKKAFNAWFRGAK